MVLENVDSIKYTGVTITHDLRGNTHSSNMCTKAFPETKSLSMSSGCNRGSIYGTCPILEYDSCVWDPHGVVLQQNIEQVQNRAARFVTSNNCFETGSMTGIQEELK